MMAKQNSYAKPLHTPSSRTIMSTQLTPIPFTAEKRFFISASVTFGFNPPTSDQQNQQHKVLNKRICGIDLHGWHG